MSFSKKATKLPHSPRLSLTGAVAGREPDDVVCGPLKADTLAQVVHSAIRQHVRVRRVVHHLHVLHQIHLRQTSHRQQHGWLAAVVQWLSSVVGIRVK